MAITYSIKVDSVLKANSIGSLSDVITEVHIIYSGVDEDGNEGKTGKQIVLPSPDASNFKDLSSVTEADILGWIDGLYPVNTLKARVDLDINSKKKPESESVVLDWMPQPTEEAIVE